MYSHNPVLIFGGTGSLGKTLVKRFLEKGKLIVVFSRDEAKHHRMAQEFPNKIINYVIGDIRDYDSVERALRRYHPDVIINAAAMKQVPACEENPHEALRTNTIGSYNVVKAVETLDLHAKVLSISTDKACKPVNSYGMTKALQERIHLNGRGRATFNCVRYGNVLESTGSVIPVFKKLKAEGKTITVTDERMTRFLMSLDQAVDLISRALDDSVGGKIFIPKVRSAKITDLARCFSAKPYEVTGIRPGEKIDEILISEEELLRVEDKGDIFVIHDFDKWQNVPYEDNHPSKEYSSRSDLMTYEALTQFLKEHNVI